MHFNPKLLKEAEDARKIHGVKPNRQGRLWSVDEEDSLVKWFTLGRSIRQWAKENERAYDVVVARLSTAEKGMRRDYDPRVGHNLYEVHTKCAANWPLRAPIFEELCDIPRELTPPTLHFPVKVTGAEAFASLADSMANAIDENLRKHLTPSFGVCKTSKDMLNKSETIIPTTQEKPKMNAIQTVKVETVTRINGKDADTYSDEDLLALATRLNHQKAELEKLLPDPLAKAHIAKTDEGIKQLSEYNATRAAKVV